MTPSSMSSAETHAAIARAGKLDVYELFASRAGQYPNAVAIQQGALQITYGGLHERVLRLASALQTKGISRGDRIALLSENRFEYAELELAAAYLGVIIACQNWRLAAPELQHCINLVAPKLVVVTKRFTPLLANIDVGATEVLCIEEAYEAMLSVATPGLHLRPDVDPEDGIVILYTSGTTGLPKGALISHRAEIARMMVLRLDMRATEDDGFVAWAPMFHMGSTDQVLGALMSGATVFMLDGFDPNAVVNIIENHNLGWMLLMPGSIEPVVELLKQGRKTKSIRAIGAMADLVPKNLVAELSGLSGAPYLNSFGSTETGLPPTSASLIPPGIKPTSLSKTRSSLCELRLVNPDGNDVPDGDAGEAAVRGPTIFSGYWNAPETNARDFHNGWFRMGDLLRRNPDGTYDFVDRAKYMIKSGGENIYPAEIERVLLADPRIRDAVVIKKLDAKWGEIPVAFVARKDESLVIADIEAMCRAALAGYKRPREIHFIAYEDLPRSTTGKIVRHELEHMLKSLPQ